MTVPTLDDVVAVVVELGTPWENGRPLWVFGYGSLMYRVDFPIEAKVAGYIHGRRRAFLQKSHDHRGTALQPGRVCTLLPTTSESVCWGVAYKVQAGKESEVKAQLDHREKDGYSIEFISVHSKHGVLHNVMVYVGVCTNPSFAGDSSLEDTAQVIARAEGPSGSNREYLYMLCDTLRGLEGAVIDEYLVELERLVRAIEQ
ncbi:Cation transport regulator-like protein 2 [Coemansia sp. RSA 2050]|nr:Cation transport regulator-like protein 2 [Coemansia sp. RSA 2050]KAJ2729687.1 Cation transport regulator-like protein 2 [Coemansia sp. BCRC 34962]